MMVYSDKCLIESCSFKIRPFEVEDANKVLQIRRDNLQKADNKEYPDDIIQAMLKNLSCERLVEVSKEPNRIILVATVNSKVVGSVSLLNNSVRLMFVDPNFPS